MNKLNNTLEKFNGLFDLGRSTGSQGLTGFRQKPIVKIMSPLQYEYDDSWYRIQQQIELERIRQSQADQRFNGMFNGRHISYDGITVKWSGSVEEKIGTYPRKMLLLL